MKKSTRNILLGTGIAFAGMGAVAATTYTITKKMLSIAMDRKQPKNMTKGKKAIAGAMTRSLGLSEEFGPAAEKLRNSGCEEVEITSRDGIRLAGHWHGCENPRRVIVAMHGWRSSWAWDFGTTADFWHENGCAVLYAEQRGQGESGGDYMGFGLLERHDCLEWVNWVTRRCGSDVPVYLAGVSMGATTVLMTAGLSLPDNVRGIVADCGFTSPHAIWKHVVENNLHLSYKGVRGAIADDMCRKKINIGTKDYSAVDAMRECTVPVLFIHGTDDRFVPIEMTYENYKACASPKRLFVVPGAGHAMSYLKDKEGYEKAVLEFWKDFDPAAE